MPKSFQDIRPQPKQNARVNPETIIMTGPPKVGKSTAAALAEEEFPGKTMIVSVDKGKPYDYIEGAIFKQIDNPFELDDLLDEWIREGIKIPLLFFDNGTVLDQWSYIMGTVDYMNTKQGSKFNTDSKTGKAYPIGHKDYQTVDTVGKGYGYRFLRKRMNSWKSKLEQVSEQLVIFVHLKDKDVYSEDGNIISSEKVISLTGQMTGIWPAFSTALGFVYAKGKERYINWESSTKLAAGSRAKHLNGHMLLSQMDDEGVITTFWKDIYPDGI